MWTKNLIQLSDEGRKRGKQVCLHTHFEHPNEITWVTKAAAHHLFKNGVIVRNQSVLLKGINDSVETMGQLIRELGDMNITPVSILQCTVPLHQSRVLLMLCAVCIQTVSQAGQLTHQLT